MSTCAVCTTPAAAGADYCIRCGAALAGAAPPAKLTTAICCDLCAAETDPKVATPVPADEVARLANSGYGENITLWKQWTAAEKRNAFEQLANKYAWPWSLCPTCEQKTRAARLTPIVTPIKQPTPTKTPVPSTPIPPPPVPKPAPTQTAGSNCLAYGWSFCVRSLLFLFALGVALVAIDTIASSYRKTPRMEKRFMGMDLLSGRMNYLDFVVSTPHPQNAMHLYMGLFCAGLTLVTVNRVFRLSSGRGPIDFVLGQPRLIVFFLFAGVVALFYQPVREGRFIDHTGQDIIVLVPIAILFGALYLIPPIPAYVIPPLTTGIGAVFLTVLLGTFAYRFHFDPDKAAFAFDKQFVNATDAGNYLFGRGTDEKIHVALLTPELVRQLQAHAVSVNASGQNDHRLPKRDPNQMIRARQIIPEFARSLDENLQRIEAKGQSAHEFPVAGVLPIVLVSVLALLAVYAHSRNSPLSDNQRAVLAGAFGLVNWYLIWWFAAAVQDAWFKDNRPQLNELIYTSIYLIPLAMIFLAACCFKMRNADLSARQRAGWTTVYFTVHLAAIGGVYLVSYKSLGNPALLWLLIYLVPASICWLWSLPRYRELQSSQP